MKKTLIQCFITVCFITSVSNSLALSDEYFSSGEDLDLLVELKSTTAIEELEYTLRQFVLYRRLEDLLSNNRDEYSGINHF